MLTSARQGAVNQEAPGHWVVVAGEPYGTAAKLDLEYHAEARRLELAPGWAWPSDPVSPTVDGHIMMYERGFGRQAADRFWFCSWAATASEARAGPEVRLALARLPEIFQLYYYRVSLAPSSRSGFRREILHAQDGNLAALKQDMRLNCS